MAKCRSCATSRNAQVTGFEDVPYVELASAVVAGYGASKIDTMLTENPDGTAKVGFLVDNPMARNAMFIGAGVGMMAYLKGEMYKGAGIGMASYGGLKLIEGLMTPATPVVAGLRWSPPQNIAGMHSGMRTLPGNYGVAPNIVAGTDTYQGSNYEQDMFEDSQMAVSGLVRAF